MQMQCTANDVKYDEQNYCPLRKQQPYGSRNPGTVPRIALRWGISFSSDYHACPRSLWYSAFPGIPTFSAPSRREEFVSEESLQPPSWTVWFCVPRDIPPTDGACKSTPFPECHDVVAKMLNERYQTNFRYCRYLVLSIAIKRKKGCFCRIQLLFYRISPIYAILHVWAST